ncbi:hypothetical protein [Dyadobacter sandarakinus]|nr:hypothetical protein [Dyadobacter sandarakinus]
MDIYDELFSKYEELPADFLWKAVLVNISIDKWWRERSPAK